MRNAQPEQVESVQQRQVPLLNTRPASAGLRAALTRTFGVQRRIAEKRLARAALGTRVAKLPGVRPGNHAKPHTVRLALTRATRLGSDAN